MIETDINAVQAAVYRFFLGLDRRDHHMVAELMARTGVWHRQGVQLMGPDAVLAALEERDAKRHTAHTITNLWLESMTANSARARYYLVAYETKLDEMNKESVPKLLGIRECIDDFILEDGNWRVQNKQSTRLLPSQ